MTESVIKFVVPIALREVMEALLPAYEAASGHRCETVHMLNPEVPAYAARGVDWHMAITNPPYVAAMVGAGHADGASQASFARAPLAFGKLGTTGVEPLSSPDEISALLVAAQSVAITDVGTSGGQFRTFAHQLGIWQDIAPRIVGLEGGGPMKALLSGDVELAALPLTNIAPIPEVGTIAVCPTDMNAHIDLTICLREGASEAAHQLAQWLCHTDRDVQLRELGGHRF